MFQPVPPFCQPSYLPVHTAADAADSATARRPRPVIGQQPQPRQLAAVPVAPAPARPAAAPLVPTAAAPAPPAPQIRRQGAPPWCLALWGYGQHLWQQMGVLAQQLVPEQGDGAPLPPYVQAIALAASVGLPGDGAMVVAMLAPGPAPARLPPVAWRHYDRLEPLAQAELGEEPPRCTISLKELAELRQPVAIKHGAAVQIFEFDELTRFWWHMPQRMGLTPSYTPITILYRVVRDGAAEGPAAPSATAQ